MKSLFVAKIANGTFIGQFPAERIGALVQSGEIKSNYVVSETDGSSYTDFAKTGTARWISVADFLGDQPVGENKILKINLKGGILGLLAGKPDETLNHVIQQENQSGWRVVQVFPDSSLNLLTVVWRMILLVCTLFFYTETNGYYIVFEKVHATKKNTELGRSCDG